MVIHSERKHNPAKESDKGDVDQMKRKIETMEVQQDKDEPHMKTMHQHDTQPSI